MLLVAACGGSAPDDAVPTSTVVVTTAAPDTLPNVSGAFGSAPIVHFIPGAKPPKLMTAVTVTPGNGAAVASGDATVVKYAVYNWRTGQAVDSSYDPKFNHHPLAFVAGTATGLNGLLGRAVGSRVLLVFPPPEGAERLAGSLTGVENDDTLVYVFDIVQSSKYLPPGSTTSAVGDPALPQVSGPSDADPTITIPPNTAPPTSLVTKTLIQGSGKQVKPGDIIEARYTGVVWRNGQVFDSTAKDGNGAFSATLSTGQLIPGWVTGLTGQRVGSRVLLVVPPAEGYGPQGGQPSSGIQADDTLVFVIDILAD